MEQKLSGSRSGLQSILQSRSRSRRCTGSHGTFIFNTTKRITLLFIVQSLLNRNPPSIGIKIIRIVIQIECLHGTKFLDPNQDLDCNLDKLGIRMFLSAHILVMYECLSSPLHTFLSSPWCKSDTILELYVVNPSSIVSTLACQYLMFIKGQLVSYTFIHQWGTRNQIDGDTWFVSVFTRPALILICHRQ